MPRSVTEVEFIGGLIVVSHALCAEDVVVVISHPPEFDSVGYRVDRYDLSNSKRSWVN